MVTVHHSMLPLGQHIKHATDLSIVPGIFLLFFMDLAGKKVVNYDDYDSLGHMMPKNTTSIHVTTLNLPNKFGGEKCYRSGGRNYVYHSVLM